MSTSSKDLLSLEHTISRPKALLVGEPKRTNAPTIKPIMRVTALEKPSVLGKLDAFLPQMEAANAQLADEIEHSGAEKFNIEHVEDEDAPHIEMDMAFLFDLLQEPSDLSITERIERYCSELMDQTQLCHE